jgi:hypothetical protein
VERWAGLIPTIVTLGPSCAGLTRASIKKSFICQSDGLPGQAPAMT